MQDKERVSRSGRKERVRPFLLTRSLRPLLLTRSLPLGLAEWLTDRRISFRR